MANWITKFYLYRIFVRFIALWIFKKLTTRKRFLLDSLVSMIMCWFTFSSNFCESMQWRFIHNIIVKQREHNTDNQCGHFFLFFCKRIPPIWHLQVINKITIFKETRFTTLLNCSTISNKKRRQKKCMPHSINGENIVIDEGSFSQYLR